MAKWQSKRKTIPHKETKHEPISQHNNEKPDADAEEQVRLLTGALLTLASFTAQFALSLEQAVQSNLVTPVTREALSFALWEMVNLTMSMSDQLRISISTLPVSLRTSRNNIRIASAIDDVNGLLEELIEEFDL